MRKTLTSASRIAAVAVLSGAVGVAFGVHTLSVPATSVINTPSVVLEQPADAATASPSDAPGSPTVSPTAMDTLSPSDSATALPSATPLPTGTPADTPTPASTDPTATPAGYCPSGFPNDCDAAPPTPPPAPPAPTATPVPVCDTSPVWSGSLNSQPVMVQDGTTTSYTLGDIVSTPLRIVGARPAGCTSLIVKVDELPVVANDGTPVPGTPHSDVLFTDTERFLSGSGTVTDTPRGRATVQVQTDGNIQFSVEWSAS